MPVYEYRCRHCGTSFEHLLLRASPPARCPGCSGGDLEQLISAFGMSSESTRQSSLSGQHRKVAAARQDRAHAEHRTLHEHFEDPHT
jgi:putative FmdB family regulatory protein